MIFLLVITVLVFIHELGHYAVARWCGVRVEVFSVGLGRELFGYTDRHGTRWKLSIIPLGGYVRMHGEAFELRNQTQNDGSFWSKSVGQRAAVTAAGPAANFLFAILVATLLYLISGMPFGSNEIGTVYPGSPAAAAGLREGDKIVKINDVPIASLEELHRALLRAHVSDDGPVRLQVDRDGTIMAMVARPGPYEVMQADKVINKGVGLGIAAARIEYRALGVVESIWAGTQRVYRETVNILTLTVGLFTGAKDATKEIGGIIAIATVSEQVAVGGTLAVLGLMMILSINLGILNLFPVPILDGGHLVYYAIEAVRGRPVGERAREIGAGVGLVLLVALMVFGIWNDLRNLL